MPSEKEAKIIIYLCPQVRKAEPSDRALFSAWRAKRCVMDVPDGLMPPTCLVACLDRQIAAGYLIKTDAGFATISGLISDPDALYEERDVCLKALLQALIDHAREAGYPVVSASTNLGRLAERYKELGFIQTDQGLSAFLRMT